MNGCPSALATGRYRQEQRDAQPDSGGGRRGDLAVGGVAVEELYERGEKEVGACVRWV